MDFDIKYVIIAVGALLIVAIIGHHLWRAWRLRQPQDGDDASADSTPAGSLWDDEGDRPVPEQPTSATIARADADVAEEQQGAPTQRTEPHIAAPDAEDADAKGPEPSGEPEPPQVAEEVEETVSKARSVSGARERPSDPDERRRTDREGAGESAVDEYVAIWVVAKDDERFSGDDLLRAFAGANLEYGERNVFHRRQGDRSQFMVVNGTEPGTFDLAAMGEFSTPAVVATMTLPGPDDPIATFNAMLTTARALESALNGTLKDEELNAMSYQTIEHCRSRVAEFARRQMSQRP